MASRTYVEGRLTLVQRANVEARLSRVERRIVELEEQRAELARRLAADIQARISTGELELRRESPTGG